MFIEDRDNNGRLRVPYFVKLISDFLAKRGIYNAGDFKSYVESLVFLKRRIGITKPTVIQNGSIALTVQHKRFKQVFESVFHPWLKISLPTNLDRPHRLY